MTWFLRKSFRFGPLRLNLSKRGVGASVGVTGARLGVDATGKPYAAGGRYGLYFRKRLGPGRSGRTEPALSAEKTVSPPNDSVLRAQGGPAPRTRRLWLLVALALLIGLLVGAWLAHAGDQGAWICSTLRDAALGTPSWTGTRAVSITSTPRAGARVGGAWTRRAAWSVSGSTGRDRSQRHSPCSRSQRRSHVDDP